MNRFRILLLHRPRLELLVHLSSWHLLPERLSAGNRVRRRKLLSDELVGADAVSARHLLQRHGSDEFVDLHAVSVRNEHEINGINEH